MLCLVFDPSLGNPQVTCNPIGIALGPHDGRKKPQSLPPDFKRLYQSSNLTAMALPKVATWYKTTRQVSIGKQHLICI